MPCPLCDDKTILDLVYFIDEKEIKMKGSCPCTKEFDQMRANPDCSSCKGRGRVPVCISENNNFIEIGESSCLCILAPHTLTAKVGMGDLLPFPYFLFDETNKIKSLRIESGEFDWTYVYITELDDNERVFLVRGAQINLQLQEVEEKLPPPEIVHLTWE